MKKEEITEFKEEIQSFWRLSLWNLVFGSIVMAFGIMFVVTRVQVMLQAGTISALPVITVAVGLVAAGVGMKWILSSVRIFRDVKEIKIASDAAGAGATEEDLTGFRIGMMAQYREKKPMIHTMMFVSLVGGACFLGLGVANVVQMVSAIVAGTLPENYLLVPAALLNLAIGGICLLNSLYFRRYSAVWDRRLGEIARSEGMLADEMEQDPA
jgi:hypothetical protein